MDTPGERIAKLSTLFLGTPYQANSLVGSPDVPEQLIFNLAAVDCFTLLDNVEALRRSTSLESAVANLRQLRYRNGVVAYHYRNHFFSDWLLYNSTFISDVTAEIGRNHSISVTKQLNHKRDSSSWLPDIPAIPRQIDYIPAEQINAAILDRLHNGDYLGIYSPLAGLDVSHTGIVIKTGGCTLLLHASSKQQEVVDVNLSDYLQNVVGIVVYRGR